jgi:hypothetical protein
MNIKAALLAVTSKAQLTRMAQEVGQDPERFAAFLPHFLGLEYRLTQRAAAVLNACLDKYPLLLQPHLEAVIMNLNRPVSAPVKRNTLRMLQHQAIPENLQGLLAGRCFEYIGGQEPPAIKAFALTVLANLARQEPDLNHELKLVIEDQWPYASPAFKSRAGKILLALKKKPVANR